MYLEALERQMSVCSFDGAARLTRLDKHYWNVVSICGPRDHKAVLPLAKTIYYACFDDVEDACSEIYRAPREADIAGIFAFIRSLDSGPPHEPLMVHCQQGISRSAAVALSFIYGHLPPTSDRLAIAVDLILELRPQVKPNRLVLALGLAQFLPPSEAHQITNRMLSDPRIQRNQFYADGLETG
jgi:predicted protein tyrosine phosphatase